MSRIPRDVRVARAREARGGQARGGQAKGLLAKKPGTADQLGIGGHNCNCNGK